MCMWVPGFHTKRVWWSLLTLETMGLNLTVHSLNMLMHIQIHNKIIIVIISHASGLQPSVSKGMKEFFSQCIISLLRFLGFGFFVCLSSRDLCADSSSGPVGCFLLACQGQTDQKKLVLFKL